MNRSPFEAGKFIALMLAVTCAGIFPTAWAQRGRRPLPAPAVSFEQGRAVARIPFELGRNNHVFLRVRVNDSGLLWFILDTGATTLISLEQAQSLGLKFRRGAGGFGVGENAVEASEIETATLALPGVSFRERGIAAVPGGSLPTSLEHRIDGLLGASFLRRFVVEIDYRARALTLHSPRGYRYSGRGERVPVRPEEDLIFARAAVKPRGLAPLGGWFEIDSGGGHAVLLNSPFVTTHNLLTPQQRADTARVESAGGTAGVVVGELESLRLGRVRVERPRTLFSVAAAGMSASDEFAGSIGAGVLSRFKVVFDYSRRVMILEPDRPARSTRSDGSPASARGYRIPTDGRAGDRDCRDYSGEIVLEGYNTRRRLMKKLKDNMGQRAQRPPRAEVSEKEALKRMQEFTKRKASFAASVRAVKG